MRITPSVSTSLQASAAYKKLAVDQSSPDRLANGKPQPEPVVPVDKTARPDGATDRDFRTEKLGFGRVSAVNANQKRVQIHADARQFAPREQRALQAYAQTERYEQLNSKAEFVGAVDLFV